MNKTVNKEVVSDIVAFVKQNIIFGRMRPRERLIEEELTSQFGTSRHLVRAAMVELEQLGLVTRRPNKGAMVRDFSVEEVDQIYQTRALLQAEAARQIPMPAPADLIRDLEKIHAEYCAAHDAGDLQRVCSLNNDFHNRIWKACQNTSLVGLIDRLWTETLGIRCYGIGDPQLLKIARDEHSRMIELLRNGDREKFIELTIEHIKPSLEAYKRAHGGWGRANMPGVSGA